MMLEPEYELPILPIRSIEFLASARGVRLLISVVSVGLPVLAVLALTRRALT